MADLDAAGVLDVVGDAPVTVPRRAQVTHFGKSALFGLVFDQRAILTDPPTERPIAAEVLPGALLVTLRVANPLADPLALELGDRREVREDELGDAIAGDIATKIEEPQRDPPVLEVADDRECVERGAEHPVELGGDHDVAGSERSDKPRSFRSIAKW